ncbi:unnamed protein product [Lampetra planeri]
MKKATAGNSACRPTMSCTLSILPRGAVALTDASRCRYAGLCAAAGALPQSASPRVIEPPRFLRWQPSDTGTA